MIENQTLTLKDIQQAYDQLGDPDRINIERMAKNLIVRIKTIARENRKSHPGYLIAFTFDMALEILAKTGIWMIQNGGKQNES